MKVKITLLSSSFLLYIVIYGIQNFIGRLFFYERFKKSLIASASSAVIVVAINVLTMHLQN